MVVLKGIYSRGCGFESRENFKTFFSFFFIDLKLLFVFVFTETCEIVVIFNFPRQLYFCVFNI